MYLGISVENFITIGIMLLIWIIIVHLAAQFFVTLPSWIPGVGN